MSNSNPFCPGRVVVSRPDRLYHDFGVWLPDFLQEGASVTHGHADVFDAAALRHPDYRRTDLFVTFARNGTVLVTCPTPVGRLGAIAPLLRGTSAAFLGTDGGQDAFAGHLREFLGAWPAAAYDIAAPGCPCLKLYLRAAVVAFLQNQGGNLRSTWGVLATALPREAGRVVDVFALSVAEDDGGASSALAVVTVDEFEAAIFRQAGARSRAENPTR